MRKHKPLTHPALPAPPAGLLFKTTPEVPELRGGEEPATAPIADNAASDDDNTPLLLVMQRADQARAAKDIANAQRNALQELAKAAQGPAAAPARAAPRRGPNGPCERGRTAGGQQAKARGAGTSD